MPTSPPPVHPPNIGEDVICPVHTSSPADTHDFPSLLVRAQAALHSRMHQQNERFKSVLQTSSNAITTVRMLQNLSGLPSPPSTLPEEQDALSKAVRDFDQEQIFNVNGRIEKCTLASDPMYIEAEERRRRDYSMQTKKRSEPPISWASGKSSRLVQLMRGDYQGSEEVTEEDQRSCISRCAWGFAIIGMLVAIAFLIVDFWSAQTSPAISTRLVQNEELELPVVWTCLNFPLMPSFWELEPNYKGFPLLGLRGYQDVDKDHVLMWPQTKLLTDSGWMGGSECGQRLRYMDKKSILRELSTNRVDADACFSCVKFGHKTPVELKRSKAIERRPGAVTLEFSVAAEIEFCFNPYKSGNKFMQEALLNTVEKKGEDLVERGIVELRAGPSISFALRNGFADYRNAFGVVAMNMAQATVLCNLFFFSGYFFPVKPGTEVRYSYDINEKLDAWKPLGDVDNFITVQNAITTGVGAVVDRQAVYEEMVTGSHLEGKLMHSISLDVYVVNEAQDQPGMFTDYATSLRQSHQDLLLITKKVENEKAMYTTSVHGGMQKFFPALGRSSRFNISLDFETFDTEIITRRPTTSTAEFVTDVFEYIGLFTGVCAYSVLVGPARMYLKKTRQMAGAKMRWPVFTR